MDPPSLRTRALLGVEFVDSACFFFFVLPWYDVLGSPLRWRNWDFLPSLGRADGGGSECNAISDAGS